MHPFRFLRGKQRDELIASLVERRVPANTEVFRQYDTDQSVYLIAAGTVEVFDPRRSHDDLITVIPEHHYVGEWEAIFQEPRMFSLRSRTECRLYALSGERFRRLLAESPGFAQGFGTILRDNQGIFSAFDQFKVELLQAAGRGHISIEALLPLYRALRPALHPGIDEPSRIDLGALLYAVRRLPDNVTRTFAFLLVDELPAALEDSVDLLPAVGTAARRRDIWEVLPGKDLVLLRTGDSDLIDLTSSLCLYAVEARKIRERVIRGECLTDIESFLAQRPAPAAEECRTFLSGLPFSRREVEGLLRIWPHDAVQRVSEISRHREMFNIDVRRRQRDYHARRGELWTGAVARSTAELIGLDPVDLPAERGVHIISSNTHSVSNCLNPWFREHSSQVRAWAETTGHPALEETWTHPQDLVYALARSYVAAHPDQEDAIRDRARHAGHHELQRTVNTGIRVQLIDLARLQAQPVDPELYPLRQDSPAADDLVVNIDYAFGEQAEYVIRNLLTLYGENVRSVSFLGKAGALLGQRGDLLAPTAFIEQHSDLFQPLPEQKIPAGLSVHRGPMLTVDGTLLQNRQMLNFYRQIWNVTGMEMEGTHYYRQVLESRELGVIRPDVSVRFLYYVSDLPLEAGASLAAPLGVREGVPPLYAITRHMLNQIIGGEEE